MDGSRGGVGGRSRKSGRTGETLVSARQREGGSLPSNVNDNEPDIDSIICPNYTSRATLEVSGTRKEEHMEESNTVSAYQGNCIRNGMEEIPLQVSTFRGVVGYNPPKEEVNYATLCVGPVETGAMLYPPSPMQHVSVFSIPPPQIHVGSDEHRIKDNSDPKKLNINRKGPKKATLAPSRSDSAPASVIIQPPDDDLDSSGEGLLGFPLTTHWRRYSSFTYLDFQDPNSRVTSLGRDPAEVNTRSLDENGNALGCPRIDSNTDRKKQRRVKTKNDRNNQNVILSNDIEGYRGGADIETLMEYIETPSNKGSKPAQVKASQANVPRSQVKVRAKEEESRPAKRRPKEKIKRCNSLEEISKTKLEDLTEESSSEKVNNGSGNVTKKQVTVDDAQLGKKSTWVEKADQAESTTTKKSKGLKVGKGSSDVVKQDSEFHVVTKKQRKKKRRSGGGGHGGAKQVFSRGFPAHDRTLERDGSSGLLYQFRHGRNDQSGSQPRRKSASSVPPSDKSDSSDLDSVHSLPVSSTTKRTTVGSVSGDSTPQASYADIARTAASPPGLGSQGNIGKQSREATCAQPDFSTCSDEDVNIDMLPAPLATTLIKKDAMTDTTCDKHTPAFDSGHPTLLELKLADLVLDPLLEQTENIVKDDSSSEDKVPVESVLEEDVISLSESGPPVQVPTSLPVDAPPFCIKPPTVVKRPPVILMNEPMASSQVPPELTFGFEVNQQLLQCDEDSECNVAASSSSAVTSTSTESPPVLPNRPRVPKRLIQYMTSAWEDTMKDLEAGRARYYDPNE